MGLCVLDAFLFQFHDQAYKYLNDGLEHTFGGGSSMLWLRTLASVLCILTTARLTYVKPSHSFTQGLKVGVEKLGVLGHKYAVTRGGCYRHFTLTRGWVCYPYRRWVSNSLHWYRWLRYQSTINNEKNNVSRKGDNTSCTAYPQTTYFVWTPRSSTFATTHSPQIIIFD